LPVLAVFLARAIDKDRGKPVRWRAEAGPGPLVGCSGPAVRAIAFGALGRAGAQGAQGVLIAAWCEAASCVRAGAARLRVARVLVVLRLGCSHAVAARWVAR
jgi:hypothetical protein